MKKVSIFVDVQNIYYTTKERYKCHFDYNAFWAAATQEREVAHAFAYAIHRGNEKQLQFQNILRGIGFEVKLKPFIQRRDGLLYRLVLLVAERLDFLFKGIYLCDHLAHSLELAIVARTKNFLYRITNHLSSTFIE